jgi:hypothetical protein
VTYVDSAVTESWSANVYSIQATNPNGSTYSDSVTQYLVPPGTVTVVVTPNATSNSVTISWKPGLPGTFGLIGYRVYKGLWGPPAVNPTPGATFTPTPTPITIISFDPTVGYTVTPVVDSPIQDHMGYWVQPVDGVSQIGPSGIPAPPYFKLAPTPPSSLQVAATPNANNTFSISWAPGAPGFFGLPNHYELDRTVLAVTSPTPVATVPYGQNSVSDVVSGFGSGSTVIYGLKLVDAQGNPSDLLQQVSNAMTLTGVVAAPARPTVLPFSGSISGIQYAWLMDPLADGVTAYQVYPNDWPTLTPVAAPVTVFASGPATFVFNPSPTPWVPNTYYLVAQNTVTVSSPVTLSGIPVTNYQVLANVVPGSKSVSVNWDLVPPAGTTTPSFDHYGIYRSRNPNSGYSLIATVGYPVTVYQDTTPTVTPGIDYYYQVTVRSGQSSESPVDPALGAGQPATVHLWPNVPTGVVAQAAATQTTLQWLANAGTEGVTAYEATQNGGSPMTVVSGPASFSTAFPETPGTLSVYRVIARNPSGDSDPCQPISILVPNAVTLTTVVNPPPQLAPPSSLNSSVSLLGLGYSGPVSAFKLYRQVTINGTPVISLAGSVSAGITVFNDPQPTPGYVNLYRAAGTGSGLEVGQASAPSVAVTLWPEVPIFSASGNGSAITIAWNGPVGDAPATGWNVYRNIYPTLTPAPVTTLSGGQTYVDAAVSQGTAYLYWMGSSNPAGNSGLSSPQTAMALDPPSLSITPLPEKNILSWSAITPIPGSPVTGYMVFRAVITPSATPTYSNLTGTILEPLSNTTYADSVTDGITYAYKVAGASSNGVLGAFSTPVTTTAAVQPVSMFTAVSGDRLVQLRWSYQGNPNITYILQKRLGTAPATQFQTLRTGFTGNNYDDSSVVDKNFYVYQITSVDPAGNTSTPVQAIALPAKAPVLSSSAVTLSQNTSNAVTNGNTLSWAGADQAGSFDPTMMYPLGGYAVYRSVDGGGVYQWVRTVAVTFQGGYPASPVSWTDNLTPDQLVNGNTNSYLIQAFDSPPDLPVPLSQAVTEGLVHSTSYAPVIAHTISPNTALDRNALRPFGASNERIVNIRFVVSGQGRVNIKVYNLGGTYITELINADYAPGIYWATWDGHNRSGDLVASGVYLISTESPGHQEFSKIAVIK